MTVCRDVAFVVIEIRFSFLAGPEAGSSVLFTRSCLCGREGDSIMRGEDSLGSFRRDKEGEAVLVTDSFLVGSGEVLEEPETVLAWNENRLTSEPELV